MLIMFASSDRGCSKSCPGEVELTLLLAQAGPRHHLPHTEEAELQLGVLVQGATQGGEEGREEEADAPHHLPHLDKWWR